MTVEGQGPVRVHGEGACKRPVPGPERGRMEWEKSGGAGGWSFGTFQLQGEKGKGSSQRLDGHSELRR